MFVDLRVFFFRKRHTVEKVLSFSLKFEKLSFKENFRLCVYKRVWNGDCYVMLTDDEDDDEGENALSGATGSVLLLVVVLVAVAIVVVVVVDYCLT